MVSDSKKLLRIFRGLSEGDQHSLLAFAEFLAARESGGVAPVKQIAAPVEIPRPEEESVMKAIKRLMATYPMLDRGKLLNDTSMAMSKHVMHGVPAVEVIDELEITFRRHYELLAQPETKQ